MLNRSLRQAIHLTLGLGIYSIHGPVLAQNTGSQSGNAEVENIVVTGSRLSRPEFEGPSPVTMISAEQLEREGFTTVYEAMKSFTQVNGATQDEQYTAGFTPNAAAMDVRGLGAGRTLVLLDGRRITDYPLPYDGESNFVNLAAVPMAAVERIEVLSGGASAIYGSDAIAGVINIILKKDLNTPLDINVRYGDTSEGGGETQRVQAVGGFSNSTFNVTYAAEYLKRDPIYGYQRSFMDSVQDNPVEDLRINTRSIMRGVYDVSDFSVTYVDPGAAGCSAIPEVEYSQRPGRGFYCGRADADAQQTIRNARDQSSVYLRGGWNLGAVEVFGSFNYFQSESDLDTNFDYWFNTIDPVYNVDMGQYETLQRFIFPSEIGGRDERLATFDEEVINYAVGLKGEAFLPGWTYEFTYSRSQYDVENRQRLLLAAEIDNYFLGPNLGDDIDPEGFGVPAHSVNVARLYAPLTPQLYRQLSAVKNDQSESSNDVASLVVTGDLFDTPSGAVAMATVLELGKQEYEITLDPRVAAGDFFAYGGTGGGGERDRYALGVEFGVPLADTLRATLAGRYDKYDDITQVDNAISYNLGLEYRPIQQVLLRGSLATSFRAPDMHYVFADPSVYFTQEADEYWCRREEPGVSLPDCTNGFATIQGVTKGNPELEEEEGKSYTLGVVFEPSRQLSVALDYYHIEVDGLVIDYPASRILATEADCRLGETSTGARVDINSVTCQDALARVTRSAALGDVVTDIVTGPINTANIKTSGIDFVLGYGQNLGALGNLGYQLNYGHVLKFEERNFAGDPVVNVRDEIDRTNRATFNFRSKVRGSVTWEYGDWTSTLLAERLGSIPRWDETGRIGSHMEWSGSISYRFLGDSAEASFIVDNLFDEQPEKDPTYDEYPYFSQDNYDPTGREWFVQLRYRFGE